MRYDQWNNPRDQKQTFCSIEKKNRDKNSASTDNVSISLF